MRTHLTVNEILQREHFDCTEVIAGKEGLTRIVKWVHIVEVTKVRHLLKGYELILSTGIGWREEQELFISFLEQLIESKAAALCIEIGTYTSPHLPTDIIAIANKHQFPIILFHKEVPFIEITQDIHAILINQQYQIISHLESYTKELNMKLLTIDHYIEILKFMHDYLRVQVAVVFSKKEIQVVPELHENDKKALFKKIKEHNDIDSRSLSRVPIQLLGSQYAELVISSDSRVLNEFDQLILDRTGTALAQILLRELYVEEKKKAEETEWVTFWLEGKHSDHEIKEFLSYQAPDLKSKGVTVIICKLDSFVNYSSLDLTYFKLFFRTFFEQQGFYLLALDKRNDIIFILINERDPESWKERVNEGIKRFLKSRLKIGNQETKLILGIGKYVNELSCIDKSYQTALETMRIKDRHSLMQANCFFYDELHIQRLLSLLNSHLDLHEIVMEYLEPVLFYDQKYNGKLMETLKTYMACNGSKKETAQRLYIVRQTLYHRLEKLEKLLGADFMTSSEKRLAIEVMIQAYEFLPAAQKRNQYIQEQN